jgi:hypothetical protein
MTHNCPSFYCLRCSQAGLAARRAVAVEPRLVLAGCVKGTTCSKFPVQSCQCKVSRSEFRSEFPVQSFSSKLGREETGRGLRVAQSRARPDRPDGPDRPTRPTTNQTDLTHQSDPTDPTYQTHQTTLTHQTTRATRFARGGACPSLDARRRRGDARSRAFVSRTRLRPPVKRTSGHDGRARE